MIDDARRFARALLVVASVGVAATLTAPDAPAQVTTTPAPTSTTVTVDRPPGTLAGTLLLPGGVRGTVPVVLLISGSGPTDRDGNGPGFTPASLRQLAESLATHGIASLRFDKRGVGGSASAMRPESELTFELLADDVAAWIRMLSGDSRFSRVIVAGHSEGALLGLLAMRTAPAAAYISLEGPARPADQVLQDQLARQLPPALMAQSDSILASLRRGEPVASTPSELAMLYRPSVQNYLITWFRHSAATELARVAVPCLVVQGEHDLQVAPAEADLLQTANPRCEVVRIAGMNHVLKQAPADMAGQMPTYRGPDAPLGAGLIDAIVRFVGSVASR